MKAVFARHTTAIGDAGLGKTLADFRATLQNWRKAGFITAHAEVDAGSRGIAAAVLGTDRTALGSISFVVSDRTGAATIARLGELVVAGAREVEDSLQREGCARS
jgi:DNA-binding IclR family transcriptional regulator